MASLIDGTFNFRELGGLRVTSGGTTASGVLFRSDALGGVTPTGLAELNALNISTVFDLRARDEAMQFPDVAIAQADPVHMPMLDAQAEKAAAKSGGEVTIPRLSDLYTHLMQTHAADFVAIARSVADSSGATIVHCTAGKDRTGVAIALLLGAVGVDEDQIIENYAETGPNLAGAWTEAMVAKIAAMGFPVTPEVVTVMAESPAEEMARALDWLTATHTTAADYLLSSGLSATDLESLRARLTS